MIKTVDVDYIYCDKDLIRFVPCISGLFFQVQKKTTLPFRSYKKISNCVAEILTYKGSSVLVAKSGQKLVGAVISCEASLIGFYDKSILVSDLGVLCEYRRLGIAHELMQRLELNCSYKKMYAHVMPRSESFNLLTKLNYSKVKNSYNKNFFIMSKEL